MTFKYSSTSCIYGKILLKLKLTLLLLTAVILQASATSFGQITLNEKSAQIEIVFQKIRKQSGYDFLINADILKKANPVTLNVKNLSVENVLKICLENQPFTYKIEDKTIILLYSGRIASTLRAIIVGKVFDENGNPVVGATIRVKGISIKDKAGTLTEATSISDANGNFAISADESQTLLVSYVGYLTQEVIIKGKELPLTVKLKLSDNKLQTVTINTGLFKKSSESFTGATTVVTAKELAQFGNRNLITSLRNIDPAFNIIESNAFGSNPNRMPEIQIRGNSSIPNVGQLQDQTRTDLNTPLIILDGFQSTLQKLYDMNENEVESITLLKDAAATAMYGSRGANGVVVITTKPPKAGKLRLSFRSDVIVENPDLSDYNLLKGREKLDLEFRAGYYNGKYYNAGDRAEVNLPLERYYNFLLNEVNRGVETDWMEIPLRTGIGQRHNLRLEGGDNQFRYSASAQLNDIQGVMKDSYRRTFNGNITLAYTYRNLRFKNNLQIQQGKTNESPYGTFSDYVRMNPYWAPYDDKGNPVRVVGDPGTSDWTQYWGGINLPANPLYNATLNTFDKTAISDLINNTSVEWDLIKGLTLRAQIGLTKTNIESDKFRPADHTAFNSYTLNDIFRKGDYKYGIENTFKYDGSLNLAYTKTLADNHLITAGFDFNMRQNTTSVYGFLAEGFSNPSFDFISMALQYSKNGKPTGNESFVRAIGFTGNVNYIFANKYFADASYRIDGSSQFGSKKRFAPFWSTGIGWNLHNEKFLIDNKYINRLKLRGSVGITGSQNFDAYQALSTYRYYTDQRYYNWLGSYLLGIGNENLQWQQTTKYNIGLDAEFLNRHLKIGADYYIHTTNDLVSSVNLPASNGFSSYIDNIGKMENKGFEFRATAFLLTNPKGIIWSISGALLQNRNKVLETSKALKDAQKVILNSTTTPGQLYIEGYSSNAIWVVPSLGIDPSTGKELYLAKDGLATYTWNANDIVAVGNTDPKYYGNFSTMIRYKDFAINTVFGYKFGGQSYNTTLIDRVELTNYKYNVDSRVYYSRWEKPGDVTAFKGLLVTTPTYKTSRFVQDENTLTLQNINFQYNLTNKNILQKLRLEALNFTANIVEPLQFSSIRRERGTVYPFSRQFSFSISGTF